MWMPELPMYSGEPVTTVAPSKSLVLLPAPHPQRHRSSQSRKGALPKHSRSWSGFEHIWTTVKKQKQKNKKKKPYTHQSVQESFYHSNNFQLNRCTFTNYHLCNALFHVCPLTSSKSDISWYLSCHQHRPPCQHTVGTQSIFAE